MRTLIFALVFVCPPCLKGHVLRWCWGASIGRRVRIGWFSTVLGRHVALGDYSEVRSFTIMRCDGDVRIGAYSVLGPRCMIFMHGFFHFEGGELPHP